MDKNTPAYWSLSLDTECPKCGHNFDLLCDPDFWEFSGAKQACEEIKGYETCCPECNHEFKTDFVYLGITNDHYYQRTSSENY